MGLDTYVSDAVSSSPIARPGAAMETPAGAGVDTAHSQWLRCWCFPQNYHSDHRAAGCVCRDCVVKEKNLAVVYREVVDGKKTILNAQLFVCTSVRDRGLRKECAQRVPSALSTQASPNQRRQF